MDKEKYENATPIAEINIKLYDEEGSIPIALTARLNNISFEQRITIIHTITQTLKLDSLALAIAALTFDECTKASDSEKVSLDLGAIDRMKGEGS